MTVFDDLDAAMATIVGEEFGSLVTWHPMAAKPSRYTGGDAQPDPARPIVAGLTAIVTWKPLTEAAGVTDGLPGGNRGGISSFDVSIDIAVDDFADPMNPDHFLLPKPGDILELTEEYDDNRWVEIKRAADDGSKRAIFYGTAVEASEAA
jgi:hypothetical protein